MDEKRIDQTASEIKHLRDVVGRIQNSVENRKYFKLDDDECAHCVVRALALLAWSLAVDLAEASTNPTEMTDDEAHALAFKVLWDSADSMAETIVDHQFGDIDGHSES